MRYLLSGESLALDSNLCSGCGRCEEVCPHGVFSMVDRRAVLEARDNCMQCGACQRNCARGAIHVSTGVGCAAAIINGMRRRSGTADCSCG